MRASPNRSRARSEQNRAWVWGGRRGRRARRGRRKGSGLFGRGAAQAKRPPKKVTRLPRPRRSAAPAAARRQSIRQGHTHKVPPSWTVICTHHLALPRNPSSPPSPPVCVCTHGTVRKSSHRPRVARACTADHGFAHGTSSRFSASPVIIGSRGRRSAVGRAVRRRAGVATGLNSIFRGLFFSAITSLTVTEEGVVAFEAIVFFP